MLWVLLSYLSETTFHLEHPKSNYLTNGALPFLACFSSIEHLTILTNSNLLSLAACAEEKKGGG